jgi:hypothetical protein
MSDDPGKHRQVLLERELLFFRGEGCCAFRECNHSEPLLVAGTSRRFDTAIGQESGNGECLDPAWAKGRSTPTRHRPECHRGKQSPLFRPVSSLAGDPGRLDLGKPWSVQFLEADRADRAVSDPGTERIARHQATPQDLLPYGLAWSVHRGPEQRGGAGCGARVAGQREDRSLPSPESPGSIRFTRTHRAYPEEVS